MIASLYLSCAFLWCKNGCAPPGALLAALWGDKPSLESSSFIVSEAVRTFTELLLRT